jgi:hypothetical protein
MGRLFVPTSVACGSLTRSLAEPIVGVPMTVTGRVTYSGGPGGTPTISNTSVNVNPNPGAVGHSRSLSGNTVSLTSNSFSPATAGTYTVTWRAQVNEALSAVCSGTFVVYPPTVATCGTLTVNPAEPEIGQQMTVRVQPTYSGGPPTTTVSGASLRVTPTPGNVAIEAGYPTWGGGNLDILSKPFAIATAGKYMVTWKVTINEKTLDCGGALDFFYVLRHPYMKVEQGDVLAGTGFATNASQPCAAISAPHNPTAGVVGWNAGSPGYGGAGIDYAAYALNYIQDIATSRRNGAVPQALSFSNASNPSVAPNSLSPGSGLFGGMFGSLTNCVDYWGSKPADSAMKPVSGPTISLDGFNTSGNYVYNGGGNLTINGGQISNGVRITLYVYGDVSITDRIVYAGNGGWNKLEQYPNFTLVVLGSIFIKPSVTELNGVYVAIPATNYVTPAVKNDFANPQQGTITTCANNFTGYTPANIAADNNLCNNRLLVVGSFVANHIFLLRSYGSVATNAPAEIFQYSPELWLAPTSDGQVGDTYEAVVGLPPVL